MSLLSSGLRTLAAFGLVASVAAFSANAAPLAPGQTILAPGELDPTGGAVVAGPLVTAFSGGSGGTLVSGSLTSTVVNDPANPLGGLTFTFRLSNNASPASASALSRLTTSDFAGFLTDVSFQTPPSGTVPASVDRNGNSVLGWTYSAATLGQVQPGASSALMVVQTNAKSFTSIGASILGGAGANNVASFGPVPEPASLALLAMGGMFLRRRRA